MSTGAIVGIVVGAVVLVGIIIVGILAATAIPIFNSQQAKANDLDAKVDVSTLAKEVATHFVDSPELPSIAVQGDTYVISTDSSSFTVARSEGVEFGGFEVSDPIDWCIWVTAPEGDLKDFQYSSVSGLSQGRC